MNFARAFERSEACVAVGVLLNVERGFYWKKCHECHHNTAKYHSKNIQELCNAMFRLWSGGKSAALLLHIVAGPNRLLEEFVLMNSLY